MANRHRHRRTGLTFAKTASSIHRFDPPRHLQPTPRDAADSKREEHPRDKTMTSIPGVGAPNPTDSASGLTGNDLSDVDLDEFLGLLITELQNQDPLNPMDNAQMLTQISQIREIGSTNQLTETLSTLAIGQELTMASNMIGKSVTALDTNSNQVDGVVDRVSVQTDAEDPSIRKVSVHIGDSIVDIKNIREIVDV